MAQFEVSLLNCYENWKVCLCTFCIPGGLCYLSGESAATASNSGRFLPVTIAFILCSIGLAINRRAVRKAYKIQGHFLYDLSVSILCCPCSVTQKYNEVKIREGKGSCDYWATLPIFAFLILQGFKLDLLQILIQMGCTQDRSQDQFDTMSLQNTELMHQILTLMKFITYTYIESEGADQIRFTDEQHSQELKLHLIRVQNDESDGGSQHGTPHANQIKSYQKAMYSHYIYRSMEIRFYNEIKNRTAAIEHTRAVLTTVNRQRRPRILNQFEQVLMSEREELQSWLKLISEFLIEEFPSSQKLDFKQISQRVALFEGQVEIQYIQDNLEDKFQEAQIDGIMSVITRQCKKIGRNIEVTNIKGLGNKMLSVSKTTFSSKIQGKRPSF